MTDTILTLTSSAFADGEMIPSKYTCDGEQVSPPLAIAGVPERTQSLVLLMDDPDIPQVFKDQMGINAFDHWVVYGIPPATTKLKEGEVVGTEGLDSRGNAGYIGPCPPPEHQPTAHRYIFKLYALSETLTFSKPPTLAEVRATIAGKILAEAQLTGIYDRATK